MPKITEFNPPKKIRINSDGTELVFVEKNIRDNVYLYEYSKGKLKKGEKLSLTKEAIELQMTNYFQTIAEKKTKK